MTQTESVYLAQTRRPARPTFREILWRQLDPEAYEHPGLSLLNKLVVFAVLTASLTAVLETEPTIEVSWPRLFPILEAVFTGIFSLEYVVRLWVEGENPRFRGVLGRLRYVVTPAAILDLIAILPALLEPTISNLFLLRAFRLLRILRLARLGRFSVAMHHLSQAVDERREELLLSLMLASIVLIFSAAAMYLLEGDTDPEAFGSIPRALWWSVCTLTTIGYGEIYPHTILGKICGGLTSMAGIGLIAMPTGILAAAFSDAFQRAQVAPRHRLEKPN